MPVVAARGMGSVDAALTERVGGKESEEDKKRGSEAEK